MDRTYSIRRVLRINKLFDSASFPRYDTQSAGHKLLDNRRAGLYELISWNRPPMWLSIGVFPTHEDAPVLSVHIAGFSNHVQGPTDPYVVVPHKLADVAIGVRVKGRAH
jgi:hypothetical protein